MTLLIALALLFLAALPALMVCWNLPHFHRAADVEAVQPRACPTHAAPQRMPGPVSVLIPARNEQAGIVPAVRAVLASTGVDLEIIVLDDHSSDRTAAIVEELARADRRVRLIAGPQLPSDWNGKQHACWHLAHAARFERLLFIDADVRLKPTAVQRLVAEFDRPTNYAAADELPRPAARSLLSGFPRQITPTVAEQMMIPLMYFVLLGYLPLARMRMDKQVGLGAGCGQLFLTNRADYLMAGGHAAIKSSRHDGLQLPRIYRRAGLMTDLIDASDLASVRMYSGWSSVLQGLQKNASEGIANARLIVPFSILLMGSGVFPILTLPHAIYHGWPLSSVVVLAMATLLSFAPRAMIAARFESGWLGTIVHPLAVALFIALQWRVFLRHMLGGQPVAWRGRTQ